MANVALKRLAIIIGRGVSPDYDDNGEVIFINQACIYWDGLRLSAVKKAKASSHKKGQRGYLLPGDVLINSTGTGTLGRATQFNVDEVSNYFADSHVTIFRPNRNEANSKYLVYLFQSPQMQDQIYKFCVSGSTNQIELSKERLCNLVVDVPMVGTQERIARHLDLEAAKIDGLITKQERLLELLEEKRQATITHALTRGLNPNVEPKETNIPWLGKIPAHWQSQKIKYLFKIQKRILGSEGPDVLSITQTGIKKKDTKSGGGQLAQDYSKYQVVEIGDFAMNHMDLLTGYVDISEFYGVTSPDYRVFTMTAADQVRRYYLYIFQQCYRSKIFFPLGQGSAQLGRWRLPTEAFNNFTVPKPPRVEQAEIVSYIDELNRTTDQLKDKIRSQIILLKERRTSLISHAVTGKVRV